MHVLFSDLPRGFLHGDAAHRKAAAPERVVPHARRLERVAVPDLDVVRADPKGVGRDLRPGGLVALTVRRRAGEDLHGACRMDADARALVAAPAHAES